MKNQHENVLYIAFASSNEKDMDQHFGSCEQLMIYRVTPENKAHLKTIQFTPYEGHHPKKISERLSAITNCFAVYCLACGNPVRKQLLTQGTRVVVQSKTDLIDNLLSQIQANWPTQVALRQERQLNKKQDANYFKNLAESEWA